MGKSEKEKTRLSSEQIETERKRLLSVFESNEIWDQWVQNYPLLNFFDTKFEIGIVIDQIRKTERLRKKEHYDKRIRKRLQDLLSLKQRLIADLRSLNTLDRYREKYPTLEKDEIRNALNLFALHIEQNPVKISDLTSSGIESTLMTLKVAKKHSIATSETLIEPLDQEAATKLYRSVFWKKVKASPMVKVAIFSFLLSSFYCLPVTLANPNEVSPALMIGISVATLVALGLSVRSAREEASFAVYLYSRKRE